MGTLAALVALVVGCWILASPRSAGPDEPGHLVFAGGIVRTDLDGRPHPGDPVLRQFELPAWVGAPDPVCWAQKPTVPAACADEAVPPAGSALLHSRVADSPVWGHVLPGLGTFAPREVGPWLARVLAALIPVILVSAGLTRVARQGRLALSAAVLALTPLAWFTFAVVNPSGLAIAGGFALWVDGTTRATAGHRGWLSAAGWAALVLPRRDGLVWACLILLALLLSERRTLIGWWAGLQRGPRVLAGAATVVSLHWALTSDHRINRFAVLAPLGLVAVEVWRPLARRALDTRLRRATAASAAVIVGVVGLAALVTRRSDVDTGEIAGRTGQHLDEAIGVLGWVDTPIPATAASLWLLALGIVAATALIGDGWRPLVVAGAVVAAAIGTSWVVQLVHEATLGPYWQGRYYLPLVLGVPLLLGRASLDDAVERRVAIAVAASGVAVWNLAFLGAIRRWSVGVDGSLRPWQWGGYDVPVTPLALIAVHLVATTVLLAVAWRSVALDHLVDRAGREATTTEQGRSRPRPRRARRPLELEVPQPAVGR